MKCDKCGNCLRWDWKASEYNDIAETMNSAFSSVAKKYSIERNEAVMFSLAAFYSSAVMASRQKLSDIKDVPAEQLLDEIVSDMTALAKSMCAELDGREFEAIEGGK